MPFESQNSKIKGFYVPLKPAGFSPSAIAYGAGLCFVTCTERGGFLMPRLISWCCISAFLLLSIWSGGMLLMGRCIFQTFLNPALIFQCGFHVCSEDLQCRECFSSLFVWNLWGKEEKRLYKLPNPSLVLLSLPHILWHLHQARGVSAAGISMDQLAGGCLPWPPTIAVSCQPCPRRLIVHPSAYFHEIHTNSKIFKF